MQVFNMQTSKSLPNLKDSRSRSRCTKNLQENAHSLQSSYNKTHLYNVCIYYSHII
jgi:hypothetical protein